MKSGYNTFLKQGIKFIPIIWFHLYWSCHDIFCKHLRQMLF